MFVVIGVSGGIAAYKAVQLVRHFVQGGHDVHVVPTDDALRFVGAPTWEAISRNPVTTSVHDDVASVRHVSLGQSADLVVVAPATANTIAKMAAGLAGDLLGTTLLATTAPIVVAPAMHTEMWRHPATQTNVETLRSRGVHIVGPDDGELTGGDTGPGRLSDPAEIHRAALAVVGSRLDLSGLTVAVSAGGTREPIDPVRYIGNRSSGRQGVAVALAAADRGADVLLVAAHVDEGVLSEASAHPRIRVMRAGTAAELEREMQDASETAAVLVMAAAVADYRVDHVVDAKLTKDARTGLTLELVETTDILAGLARDRRPGQTVVGFAAETLGAGETLAERAIRKAARKRVDLLAANEVGWTQGFEATANALLFVDAAGEVVGDAAGSKRDVADALWDAVLAVRRSRGSDTKKT